MENSPNQSEQNLTTTTSSVSTPCESVEQQQLIPLDNTETQIEESKTSTAETVSDTNISTSTNETIPNTNNTQQEQQQPKQPTNNKKKKNAKPEPVALPSIKIMVLHGFQQYLERIEEKIQPWIKFLSRSYTIREVLLPIAPNRTLPSDEADPFRCWLALNREDPLDFDGRWSLTHAHYHFYEESEELLLDVFKKHPDIDIMINFSQGSLMGSLFLAKNRENPAIKALKAIINVCGVGLPIVTNPGLEFVNDLYAEKNQIQHPTLFLIGEKDVVVPLPRTEALAKWYQRVQILKFDGPHCIPKQKIYLEQVKTYIDSIMLAPKE